MNQLRLVPVGRTVGGVVEVGAQLGDGGAAVGVLGVGAGGDEEGVAGEGEDAACCGGVEGNCGWVG